MVFYLIGQMRRMLLQLCIRGKGGMIMDVSIAIVRHERFHEEARTIRIETAGEKEKEEEEGKKE